MNNKFKNLLPFHKAKFIEVGNTETVLDSIYKAIEKINEKLISIVPITTIPDLPNNNRKGSYSRSTKIPKENMTSININYDWNFRFYL